MGVERAVTRWYALRQVLQTEIARLEEKQEQLSGDGEARTTIALDESKDAIHLQLVMAQQRLKALGHCPRPMMG
jgi:FtsZ-binding cell division protein ZapB